MTIERAPRKLAPTLEEVAAAAGVSRSTASRVINGSPQVSTNVIAAVNAAIQALNYQPNRAARSLANRQTMAIALVVPEETTRFFGDPYFASVVQGITLGIADSDYVLNLQLGTSAKTERYLQGGNVDGALVVSHHSGDSFLTSLANTVPVVFNGRPVSSDDGTTHFVDVDNIAAAALGTQYLIDIGRTRIATIAGPADMIAGVDRASGWRSALEKAKLPVGPLAHGDFSLAGGARAMTELLDSRQAFDAVFVASDLMAVGAIGVLRDRGISVPADVAVVGFDDSPAATSGSVKLTTVRQPSTEMGTAMAHMLLGLLRGDEVERRTIMDTSIVVRDSA